MPRGRFLQPGQRYDRTTVKQVLTAQKNQLIVHTDVHPNTVCVSHMYKNDPLTFHCHSCAIEKHMKPCCDSVASGNENPNLIGDAFDYAAAVD